MKSRSNSDQSNNEHICSIWCTGNIKCKQSSMLLSEKQENRKIHSQMILSFESFPACWANISSLIAVSKFVFCKSARGTKCFPTLLTLYFWFCSPSGWLWLALHFDLSVFFVFRIFSRWWSRTTAVTFYSWRICRSSLLQARCWWNSRMNRACVRLGGICRIWKMKLTSYISPQNMHQSKCMAFPN